LKKISHYSICLFTLLILYTSAKGQITITNSNVASTLANKLIGTGVTISNITLTCNTNGAGTFVSTNAMLNIDSGIILTTGYAKDAAGIVGVNNPASSNATEDRPINAADANLAAFLTGGNPMEDLCKLEFDFVPQGDTVRFQYKFASEEYPEYVCTSFNDIFGFFISGPGIVGTPNLAKIPGTNLPVTINTVNPGLVGGQASSSGPCTSLNSAWPVGANSFYLNNASNTSIVYDGTTTLLESKAVVIPCSTYHMKFAIADVSDGEFDSGVFLKAGSFKSEAVFFDTIYTPVGLPINWPYATEGCNSDTIIIKRAVAKPTPQIVYLFPSGTAINGVDYTLLPTFVTIPANDTMVKVYITPIQDFIIDNNETVTLGVSTSNCFTSFSDTFSVIINEFPNYTVTDNDTICFGNSKILTATQTSIDTSLKYQWNPGLFNTQSITITPFSTSTYTLTAKYPGCPNRDSIVKIDVSAYPIVTTGLDTNLCLGQSLPLNTSVGLTLPYTIASYIWLPAVGLSSNTILNPTANPTATTCYTLTVTNTAGCTGTNDVCIVIKPSLTLISSITNGDCNNLNAGINISNAQGATNVTYTLLPNNITNTTGNFSALNSGSTYTITASSTTLCNTSIFVSIPSTPNVNFTSVVNSGIPCANNTATISTSAIGNGLITYNLQPLNITNSSGIFNGLSANTYTIVATDNNNCFNDTVINIINPLPLLINNVSIVQNNCAGIPNGLININASGGTGILNYTVSGIGNNATGIFSNVPGGTYNVIVTDANSCSTFTSIVLTSPPILQITAINITPSNCVPTNSGIININANGGTGALNYLLDSATGSINNSSNNVFNNLNPTTYTITVIDANGCSVQSITAVPSIIKPSFTSLSGTNVLCNNTATGTINAIINNGTLPYTYAITPIATNNTNGTFSNVNANTYTITATDINGCTTSSSITLTQPSAITFTAIASTPTLCNNTPSGTITGNSNGGTGAINYTLINNGNTNSTLNFSGLGAAIYTVLATDANGCTKTTTISVVQPSSLNWIGFTANNITCNGLNNGNILALAGGGTGFITYTLNAILPTSTGAYNNLSNANYLVVAADANGCSISTNAIITQPATLLITNIATTLVSCVPGNNGTISTTSSGGNVGNTYTCAGSSGTLTNANGFFTNLIADTYLITVTDSKGCSSVSFVNVENPLPPVISNISVTATGCNPNNTGTATINLSAITSTYTYNIGGGNQNTNVFTNLPAGNYTCIVTDSSNCSETQNFTITTTPNPTINNITATDAWCNPACNGSITATAFGGIGSLTYSDGTTSNTTGIFTNKCPNNYTVTVTDTKGCTSVSNINLGIKPSPTFGNAIFTNLSCFGTNNGSINTTAIGGTSPYIYTLNATNSNATGFFNNLSASNYTIVATDAFGCTAITSASIVEPAILNINNVSAISPTCNNGTNGSIVATSAGGTGVYTYSINPVATQTGVGNFTGLSGGVYTITVTDANLCTSTSSVALSEPVALNVTGITTDSATCWNLQDGGFTITANGGTGSISYTLNATTNTSGIFNNLAGANYVVVITDAANCSITSSVTVPQPPILSFANITIDSVTCFGNGNGAISINANGGIPSYTFLLNGASTNSSGLYNNLSGGIYTVSAIDAHNCIITSIVNLYEPATINFASIVGQNVTCNGSANGIITATGIGGNLPYTYNILPSVAAANNNGIFTGLIPNAYTITLTDNKNCSTISTITVTQPAALTIDSVKLNMPSCSNNSTGSIIAFASGGTGAISYTLLPNGVTNNSGQFSNLSGGTYTIVSTDASSCTTSSICVLLTPNPISFASLTQQNVLCFNGNTGFINATASGGSGLLTYTLNPGNIANTNGVFSNLISNIYTLTISDANNCTASSSINISEASAIIFNNLTLINPRCGGGKEGSISFNLSGGVSPYFTTINNTLGGNAQTFTNLGLGTYTINVQDANGCYVDTALILNAPDPLLVLVDSQNNVLCPGGEKGSLIITAQFGNPGGYTFYLLPTNDINETGIFTNVSIGTYTINVVDSKGCSGSTTARIEQNNNTFEVEIITTSPTCLSDGFNGLGTAIIIGGSAPFTFNWVTNLQALSYNAPNVDSLTFGLNSVLVTDKNGCVATDSTIIAPINCCDVFIPNAFSPNGDGVNDAFIASNGAANITLMQFSVFNRWGNQIFSTAQESKAWNGTYLGEPLTSDTYFYVYRYVCNYTGNVITKKGDVTLIR
jgi:large repetitive protein